MVHLRISLKEDIVKNFESIFADEINRFLMIRKQTVSPDTYLGDASILGQFDKFLVENKLNEKSIDENIVNKWISAYRVQKRTLER